MTHAHFFPHASSHIPLAGTSVVCSSGFPCLFESLDVGVLCAGGEQEGTEDKKWGPRNEQDHKLQQPGFEHSLHISLNSQSLRFHICKMERRALNSRGSVRTGGQLAHRVAYIQVHDK